MRIFIIIILTVFATTGFSQEKSLEIDREAWQRNTKDLSYTPEQKEEAEKPEEVSDYDSPTIPDLSGFKYVAYALVGFVIILLLVAILRNMRPVVEVSNERIEATSIEEAEENLPMVALTKIYQEALDVNDYKRALRIKFLMILQRLIDADMIVWKKRKTNEQYLKEIDNDIVLQMFKGAVKMFDDVWYGEAQISSAQYGKMVSEMDLLKNEISGEQEQ